MVYWLNQFPICQRTFGLRPEINNYPVVLLSLACCSEFWGCWPARTNLIKDNVPLNKSTKCTTVFKISFWKLSWREYSNIWIYFFSISRQAIVWDYHIHKFLTVPILCLLKVHPFGLQMIWIQDSDCVAQANWSSFWYHIGKTAVKKNKYAPQVFPGIGGIGMHSRTTTRLSVIF